MKKLNIIPFDQLETANLIIDAVYEGGTSGNTGDDPLARLLKCGNQGGFRASGNLGNERYVVLYTSTKNRDWPDYLEVSSGIFIYFGDNRTPGKELHDTKKKGNKILRRVFHALHASPQARRETPPFFVFEKYPLPGRSRSVQFKGLAVPGVDGVSSTDDLVAIWKSTDGCRFQNYRAMFSVLDIPVVPREWIVDLDQGVTESRYEPPEYRRWVESGRYKPLVALPTQIIRASEQQTPYNSLQTRILRTVWERYREDSRGFEFFAAHLTKLTDERMVVTEITQASRDGGRDAIGKYRIGLKQDPIFVEFAVEAKCYNPGLDGDKMNTVGVKETSRLISRIRNRQFGVLVTTSIISKQAYEEVRGDGHPIIFICGRDIAEILIEKGYNTVELVSALMNSLDVY